ncbi:MAG TPA: biopolymer transporter ExbD [Kofleriaceae bacterium]|nr:biopolymer transporter ExbD [Kofleriaceae bacterium]
MGMQVGKAGGVKTDINVTPLIDVVLVLLIIFLVTMPIMMRTITLTVPRKMDTEREQTNQKSITITVKADLSADIDTGERVINTQAIKIAAELQPLLKDVPSTDKLVFVDFEDPVPWEETVTVMDSIRSLANDAEHNEVKVALKMKETENAPATP